MAADHFKVAVFLALRAQNFKYNAFRCLFIVIEFLNCKEEAPAELIGDGARNGPNNAIACSLIADWAFACSVLGPWCCFIDALSAAELMLYRCPK